MTSCLNSQETCGARLLPALFHTWGEEKDNDDNYGDDVEVMLLQLRLSSYT